MKGKLALIALFLCAAIGTRAQNLVPNPGFEDINNCPSAWAGIEYAPGYNNFPTVKAWVSPLQLTTPDYFNTCAPVGSMVNLPYTFLGYHDAHTGNACAGIIAYHNGTINGEYREYVQVQLKRPMVAGHKHKVTFYASTIYDPNTTAYNFIAVDRVGAAFTNAQVNITTDKFLMLDYDVVNDSGNHITSTNAWVKIEGEYIAQGGEEWMTIGSFKNSTMPINPIQLYPATPGTGEDYSYLLVDDVTVTDLDEIYVFTARHDTAVCDASGIVLSSPVAATTYLWNTGATTQSITLADSGLYWCKAKIANKEYIDTFRIRRLYFYPGVFIGNDTLICKEDNFTLGAPMEGVTYYAWNTGATSCCIQPRESGKYYLTISNGCDAVSDTCNIEMVSCQNCFWAPNAFTPNADGKNDAFGVKQFCITTKATFSVFDRWGNLLFTTTDLTQSWDGTYKGTKAPLDTYSYMVEYWLLANKPRQVFKGNVLLIR
ncbi:MAG: gliding motility-associated C-terminal domain-containing protein [Flavipsychrobacter sp.]|nr:gliding motility-associated C-terminal domain-containing protein [Flavipsychrobacter sp.]